MAGKAGPAFWDRLSTPETAASELCLTRVMEGHMRCVGRDAHIIIDTGVKKGKGNRRGNQ